ncbi:hypothetical protein HAX54_038296, partial [Datura stramonium]|nr:hypothetical protein [Datura stramonium]
MTHVFPISPMYALQVYAEIESCGYEWGSSKLQLEWVEILIHDAISLGLSTVEQLRAADLALRNAGCNAGLGVGLQVHYLTHAFHLRAADFHLLNVGVT